MTLPSSVPKTMLAAVTREPGEARVEEMPVPALGPGDALVRTAVVGVCAGDTAPWYVAKKTPCVLGHEPAGTIVAVGPDVKGFLPGTRVFFHHHAPCFRCRHCLARNHTLCETWRRSKLDPGALAQYVRIPAENLGDTLALPEGMSFEDAALIEPLACCVKAYRRVDLRPGESVLVIGLGSIGQMLVQLARALGANPVIGADFVGYRRDRALQLGADAVIDPRATDLPERFREAAGGRLADVVIVGPGDVGAMRSGMLATAPGGRWCSFWPTPPGVELPVVAHDLYFNEITLHFSYSCGPGDTREALQWIARGVVRAKDLVTHRFPLERAGDAFGVTREAGDSIKALVVVDASQS
jgi:L-iditol 2-dehydrogenase